MKIAADLIRGIDTVCVFAWEQRARESPEFNREKAQEYMTKHSVERT